MGRQAGFAVIRLSRELKKGFSEKALSVMERHPTSKLYGARTVESLCVTSRI